MSQHEHTLKRFDADLESIRSHILKMGGLVEIQFAQSLQSLYESDPYLARQVIDQDLRINCLEVEIDALCTTAIARHQPTANDLRSIVTATKVATHLEHIGDETKKIAHLVERSSREHHLTKPHFMEVCRAAESTRKILTSVLDSFARLDTRSTLLAIDNSKSITNELDTILRQLIEFMIHNPRAISISLDNLFISNSIERICDHIEQIATLILEISNRDTSVSIVESVG